MRTMLPLAVAALAMVFPFASGQGLRPRVLRPEIPPDIFDNRSVDVARIAPERCRVELNNQRMRVVRMMLPSNTRVPIHSHAPGLIVAVRELTLRVADSDGHVTEIRLPPGDMRWMGGGVHSEENTGTSDAEYLYIEAKN